jgi:hypothetical protein
LIDFLPINEGSVQRPHQKAQSMECADSIFRNEGQGLEFTTITLSKTEKMVVFPVKVGAEDGIRTHAERMFHGLSRPAR